ncbi:MAG: 2-hydroxychromene-2-carboxylate isomerase [Pseudomonadota bacterium]
MVLRFYFEFASTYSYLSAHLIEALAGPRGISVEWIPFRLGPLLYDQQGMKDSPFNLVPVKGTYMWRDMERLCAAHDLPFERPVAFPQNGGLAARLTTALPLAERGSFVRAVYAANFAQQKDISTVAVLAAAAGRDVDEIAHLLEDPACKATVRGNTDTARSLGIFGSPSFVTPDGELFWGHDRLHQALDWITHQSHRNLQSNPNYEVQP